MKKNELEGARKKNVSDLFSEVNKKKIELAKLKMETVTGKHSDLKAVKKLKREIAQILTIITEKQLVEGKKESGIKVE